MKQYLDKIASVHGGRHPELIEIRDHFYASADELAKHMKKEELILLITHFQQIHATPIK